MPDHRSADPAPIVGKAYDFMLWIVPKAEKFPRAHRFTIGDRLAAESLELTLVLLDAAYSRDKAPLLAEGNRRLNRLRYLVRLAKDLRFLPLRSYAFAAERLDEIGRMAGGWLKQQAGAP